MLTQLNYALHLVDETIEELRLEPIDLLSIGDVDGEYTYLSNAKLSYKRTIRDVLTCFEKQPYVTKTIKILEIGSFLGVVSIVLAKLGFSVSSLDIQEYMKNLKLKERYCFYGVETLAANLKEYCIPEVSGKFDFVIMCETLEHLNFNPLPVLSEINRVLTPHGYLYLSLPNQASLVNRVKLLFGRSIHNPVKDFAEQLDKTTNMLVGIHWREYTGDEMQELVEMSGFSIASHQFYTTHKASVPARAAYVLFPKLRSNQTIIARKNEKIIPIFHFSESTR